MTENQVIANEILKQLGGKRFVAMTGARCLVAINNGLRFRFGRNGSKANMVSIVLRGDDTYTMTFLYVRNPPNPYSLLAKYLGRGMDPVTAEKKIKQQSDPDKMVQTLKEYKGIYCDQLEELFRDYTKLNTRLL